MEFVFSGLVTYLLVTVGPTYLYLFDDYYELSKDIINETNGMWWYFSTKVLPRLVKSKIKFK